jgi:hypothetical protein
MADLAQLGISLRANGDRLGYSPRSAVTPDLTERMKAHKGELLALLRSGDAPASLALAVKASVPADGKRHTVYDTTHGEYDWINEAFDAHSKPIERVCLCHKEQRWRRSIYGEHLICGICHPPVTLGVVKDRDKRRTDSCQFDNYRVSSQYGRKNPKENSVE